jgi:hypothetical protein
MAEQTKDAKPAAPKAAPKGPPKGAPKGGKGKDKGGAATATEAAPKVREGTPRLQAYYVSTIRPRLA